LDMAIEITIPRLGWSMDEGTFSQWLKQDGDDVQEGDALFELESDKAVLPVESFDAGTLRIPASGPQPGDTVKVGQSIGYLCKPGEQIPSSDDKSDSPSVAVPKDKEQKSPPNALIPEPTGPNIDESNGHKRVVNESRPVASPSVRRLARQLGVDLQSITADNPLGRVTQEQLLASANVMNVGSEATIEAPGLEVAVSPRAARAAARFGVSLVNIVGSGSGGRVRERDILAAAHREQVPANDRLVSPAVEHLSVAACNPNSNGSREVKSSSTRRTIASRMLAAAQQTASVTLCTVAQANELTNLRGQFKSTATKSGVQAPSYTDMLVKLVATVLERHPTLLGQWTDEGILVPDGVHIAVAVDTNYGLVTPVLRDVTTMPLSDVTDKLSRLIARARARQLSADELTGGTFTLSNLGGYRVDAFTPLLNMPQSGILGVGRISPQPVVVDGQVVVRDCVTLSLTFDHRVADGAAAADLLTKICEFIESPLQTLFG
jgi:pyruvate dehydrogenase E2 component (dihydrolipoamide acetyltransferase)